MGLTITHPFYRKWINMKTRCSNKNSPDYARYGARGIRVDEKWSLFVNFYNDMYPTYKKGLTLDRIDNDGNYEVSNCRWATRKEQAENRRNTHLFEYRGIADTLTNWSSYFRIKRSTLSMRIYTYKWSIEKALFAPVKGGYSHR